MFILMLHFYVAVQHPNPDGMFVITETHSCLNLSNIYIADVHISEPNSSARSTKTHVEQL